MKRHVLFLTYHLPMPDQPGAFRPWMEARLLQASGFDVTVVTSGVHYMTGKSIRKTPGWYDRQDVDGIEIIYLWAPEDFRKSLSARIVNYVALSFLMLVYSVFRARRTDAVYAGTDPIFLAPSVYLTALLKRAPLIVDERDLYPETAIAMGLVKKNMLTRFLGSMMQFIRHHAKGIVTATPGIYRTMLAYGHPEDKVHLLYNGDLFFEEDFASTPDIPDFRQITGRTFLIGYTGGLGQINDIPVLLRAAKRLADDPETGFVIIGSGENRKPYQEWCAQHGLDNVWFQDAMPRQHIRHIIRKQFDLGFQALPPDEHFHHTLTSKTFDYLAAGCPIIFCGAGDTCKVLEDSQGGISVEPGDDAALARTITKLKKDPQKLEKMKKDGAHWFRETVSLEKTKPWFSQIFETAFKNRKTS